MNAKAAQLTIRTWSLPGLLVEHYHYTAGAVEPLPKHAHSDYQLGLSWDSQGEYQYRGSRQIVPTGCLSLIHSGEAHAPSDRTSLAAPATYWMMQIDPDRVWASVQEMKADIRAYPVFPQLILGDPPLVRQYTRACQVLSQHRSQLVQDEVLLELLSSLILYHREGAPHRPPHVPTHPAVRIAQDYLRAHFRDNLSLQALADLAGLSRFHFCRIFRRDIGISPGTYQQQLRINQAKKLLAQGEPISQVATATGFYDQSHFGSCFKRIVGITPRRYQSR